MFFDDFEDLFLSPFDLDWDKKSYKFNRAEKDMHPYSVIDKEEETIIVHNVLGIDKKDLKVTKEKENGITYIVIEGKTKDTITNKEYSVSSRFALDENQLDFSKIKSTMKNGLLYIVISTKEPEKNTKDTIEIL